MLKMIFFQISFMNTYISNFLFNALSLHVDPHSLLTPIKNILLSTLGKVAYKNILLKMIKFSKTKTDLMDITT